MNGEKYVELDDPLAQVHRTRAELLEEHGGFHGYVKHIKELRERLVKEGWRYETAEERAARFARRRQHAAMA